MNNNISLNQNNPSVGNLQGLNFNNNNGNMVLGNYQQKPMQQIQSNTFKTSKSNKNDYDF